MKSLTGIIPGIRILQAAAIALFAFLAACSEEPSDPLRAGSEPVISVMDFSPPFSLDPPPLGWTHRTFWTRPAMELSIVEKDGQQALRCETNNGGSIFGRQTDIDLGTYPTLAWDWYVEVPITSSIDERTPEGDDHPARIFIRLIDGNGEEQAFEIIWSNRLFQPGDYKFIGNFGHYVANGLEANIGRWYRQEVNLLDIYRRTSGRDDTPAIKLIAIFCDSDDTGGRSVAYFSDVRLIAE